jgi:hypothetical protein
MKGFDASGVVLVHAGKNGNQRASVHQHTMVHLE